MTPAISQAEVARYVELRAAALNLSGRLVRTIPRRAMLEVGEALGLVRNEVIYLESEDLSSVLMDCCLFDWIENGVNLVQRYLQNNLSLSAVDADLLDAYMHAEYRIIGIDSVVPGAGIHASDVVSGEAFFVMDISLSRSLAPGFLLASRLVPLERYWISTGAGLPVPRKALEPVFGTLQSEGLLLKGALSRSHRTPLVVVRECLAHGAAKQIRYQDPPNAPIRVSPKAGRNDPCPCGSGIKYKRCCLRTD